jgi:hypothetical protein
MTTEIDPSSRNPRSTPPNTPPPLRVAVMEASDLARLVEEKVESALARMLGRQSRALELSRETAFMTQGLLTKQMAGRLLDVQPATLMEYVRKGELPCYRPGKAPLFLLQDIVGWVQRHESRPED